MPREHSASAKFAYSVRSFCEAFDIGKTTFYELVKSGEIKTSKIGAKTIITGTEAQRYAAKLDRAAAA